MQASLTDYPTTVSEVKTANIEFKDPCPAPEDLTATSQTDPVEYFYTSVDPSATFTLNPFTPNPPICTPSYSCNVISGPRTDLCAISDGTTSGVFSVIDGSYEFYSTDLANYPAGQYTF